MNLSHIIKGIQSKWKTWRFSLHNKFAFHNKFRRTDFDQYQEKSYARFVAVWIDGTIVTELDSPTVKLRLFVLKTFLIPVN